MGKDTVLYGELRFTDGALGAWRDTRALIASARWPSLLAPIDGETGEEHGTVEEVLGALEAMNRRALAQGPYFLRVQVDGDAVAIRGVLDEDELRDTVLHPLVGLVSAAAASGASGRLHARDAGRISGGGVEVADGAIVGKELSSSLDPEDEREFRAILAHAAAKDARSATSPEEEPLSSIDRKNLRAQRAREKARARTAARAAERARGSAKKTVAKKSVAKAGGAKKRAPVTAKKKRAVTAKKKRAVTSKKKRAARRRG